MKIHGIEIPEPPTDLIQYGPRSALQRIAKLYPSERKFIEEYLAERNGADKAPVLPTNYNTED
jgi:hypothetical protein